MTGTRWVLLSILLVASSVCAQSVGTETSTTGSFVVLGKDSGIILTCRTAEKDGWKTTSVSGCNLTDGHSLDEVMTAIVRSFNDQGERYDKLESRFRQSLQKDQKAFERIHRQLEQLQRELNHGVPLNEKEPRS